MAVRIAVGKRGAGGIKCHPLVRRRAVASASAADARFAYC
jgi:hypothetical protein